ncbi:RBBP9/YdeN family alpha/beta hydrolase [Methylovirgula sp. 4M-Z18]|uniref:RBBP9/YdeN family alpha/beta hydrolase n=1 Tax=Methylovirgula sp. 4M-Z18 TaxID=2293567 RepID=UPI000E2EC85B|nr:alpha/beta hydrolase [Methylovirgula sp. 4M-Z18]RFB80958.1 alpha/beta hydrolase [Methylovirgula sp. 4M-Z18]
MQDALQLYDFLILPGRGDSGPAHWQSHWHNAFPSSIRVVQDEWERPVYTAWAAKLDDYLTKTTKPVIFIAHSLSTALVMRWSHDADTRNIKGAFLVGPGDRDARDSLPDAPVKGFAPMLLTPLPFPSLVVASRNDPFVDFGRAQAFAVAWGSDFADAGALGHMGNDIDLGFWPQGLLLLGQFLARLA